MRVARLMTRLRDHATVRPLYVSRALTNGAELLAWARDQGFEGLEPEGELHVTIAYSRTPVDWFKLDSDFYGGYSDLTIAQGGPRAVELFGKPDSQVYVLKFKSLALSYRWSALKQDGCSWDWPEYSPHVTFAKGAGPDPEKVTAYAGELTFGPEVFAPIND